MAFYAKKKILLNRGRWAQPGDRVYEADSWPYHIREANKNCGLVEERFDVDDEDNECVEEFECPCCDASYKHKRSLARHMKEKHA